MKNLENFSINDLITRVELIMSKSRDLSAKDIETLCECIELLKKYRDCKDGSNETMILKVALEVLPQLLKFLLGLDL